MTTPLMTIFMGPKPFGKNPHIDMIQRNSILACKALGPEVEVVVIGYEDGIEETAKELGVKHFGNVRSTPQGTPLVSSIFELARQANDSPLLAMINADNLFMSDFLQACKAVLGKTDKFLICGDRLDVKMPGPIDFSKGWEEKLKDRLLKEGKNMGVAGSDYFVFPRACFTDMPDFAVGRSGWDNWMIFKARSEGWKTIDISKSITAGHENHDYSHLPGNKPPYRLPETMNNIRLAGGKRCLFLLSDADYELVNFEIVKKPVKGKRFWREFEIFPLIRLHSRFLGTIHFALVHPKAAWGEFKVWIVKIMRKMGLKTGTPDESSQ